LSGRATDIIGQIFFVIFFALMGGIPLAILILGILNFVRAVTRHVTIVMQVLASILIWAFLTYAVVMIFIVVIYSFPYPLSPANELKATGFFILGCLLYAAAGAALIYWTKRQRQLSGPAQEDAATV
jgi:hypothetical protein